MRERKNNLFQAIKISLTSIGFVFLLNLIPSYLSGYEGLPMIADEFLAGKTISEAYLKACLAMGLTSTVIYYVSFIYRKYEWSLARRTILAFGISIIAFIIMLSYLKILSSPYLANIIISLLIFLGIYFISWLKSYKSYKEDIKEINKRLKKTGN
ncbi:DUF3021 family protein [Anaerococcus sp. ENR1011]|uniref:DUF3021 family protein n=1 Tax=Anaerococcus groningensis TaxID=3115616 RepID=A0ABW9MZG9_9FIRM